MKATNEFPGCEVIEYSLDPQTGIYHKSVMMRKNELFPKQVWRNYLHAQRIKGQSVETLIERNDQQNHERKILTALQLTSFNQWYLGCIPYHKSNKSLLIIHFSAKGGEMSIFFFSGFFPHNGSQQRRFSDETIPKLIKLKHH